MSQPVTIINKDGRILNNQRGVIHLVLPVLLLLVIGAAIFGLVYFGIIKNPFSKLPIIGQKQPSVSLKSEYKNPFNKSTQYVNPFDTYKNPFVVAK